MMPRLTTLRWTSYCIVVAGVALSVCAAILAAPAIETRHFPVVIGWRAEASRELGGATILRIHGDKVRPECVYVRDSESMMLRTSPDEAREVVSVWIDDPTPGSSRPGGKQDFGALRVFTSRATPVGTEIFGVVRHVCHVGPETTTRIGGPGFYVPPLPVE